MNVEHIIDMARQVGASDVHLVCGLPVKFRLAGCLENAGVDGDAPLSHDDCEQLARRLAGDGFDRIQRIGELDRAETIGGVRVRINLFRQQGHVSAALRLLSDRIPALETLGLPSAVMDFPRIQRGIVVVTGETGSGKSTTLAALIDSINHTRAENIITMEDPIEYVYTPDQSVISQREIGQDTESYSNALRAVLREDPDVVLIGEMRDLDTIQTALTAAETGHFVLATLHTKSAADSIDRMVDEDVPCEDVLAQINAAKSALHKCGQVVLEGHIQHCVRDGIEHGDADKTIESFTKAVERFSNMS